MAGKAGVGRLEDDICKYFVLSEVVKLEPTVNKNRHHLPIRIKFFTLN